MDDEVGLAAVSLGKVSRLSPAVTLALHALVDQGLLLLSRDLVQADLILALG